MNVVKDECVDEGVDEVVDITSSYDRLRSWLIFQPESGRERERVRMRRRLRKKQPMQMQHSDKLHD